MTISLITVTFNSGDTLTDTIHSVLMQDYNDIEYIIIDGMSTDNTVDIIKLNEPKFKGRLKWISEKDNGLYDAMNKGIRMATGDIIGILNSDDFFLHNDVIEKIVYEFKNNNAQSIIADIRFVNPENLTKTVRYFSSKNFSLNKFRFGFMPAHPTFFTYKTFYEKFGNFKIEYKIAADFELLLRFLYVNKLPYTYIPYDFIKMRTGGASTSSLKSNYILNKEIVKACKEHGIYTNLLILMAKYFIKIFEFINTKN